MFVIEILRMKKKLDAVRDAQSVIDFNELRSSRGGGKLWLYIISPTCNYCLNCIDDALNSTIIYAIRTLHGTAQKSEQTDSTSHA